MANLNKEEIYHHKLHHNPPHIEEIVFPSKRINSEWIYVSVECPGSAGYKPEERNSLCADGVGEDFDHCLFVSSLAGDYGSEEV